MSMEFEPKKIAEEPSVEASLDGFSTVTILDTPVDLANTQATAEAVLEFGRLYRTGKIDLDKLYEAYQAMTDFGADNSVLSSSVVTKLERRLESLQAFEARADEVTELERTIIEHELLIDDLAQQKKEIEGHERPCQALEAKLRQFGSNTIADLQPELDALVTESVKYLHALKQTYWAAEDALQEWQEHHSDLVNASDAMVQARDFDLFIEFKSLRDAVILTRGRFGQLAKPTTTIKKLGEHTTAQLTPEVRTQIEDFISVISPYEGAASDQQYAEFEAEVARIQADYTALLAQKQELVTELAIEERNIINEINKVLSQIVSRAIKAL